MDKESNELLLVLSFFKIYTMINKCTSPPLRSSFIIFLFIGVSVTSLGQNFSETNWLDYRKYHLVSSKSHIDSIEFDWMNRMDSFLTRYPSSHFNYTYNKTIYTYTELDELIDSGIVELIKSKPTMLTSPIYQSFYEEDSHFASIIDSITKLPLDTVAYFSKSSENIKKEIKAIGYTQLKLNALLHFGKHFFYLQNYYNDDLINFFINEAFEIIEHSKLQGTTSRQNFEIIACYKLVGEFCKREDLLPQALEAYFRALQSATEFPSTDKTIMNQLDENMGSIEYQMATLYNRRESELYYSKAADHFAKAANHFALAGDTVRYLISLSKEAENLSFQIYFGTNTWALQHRLLRILQKCFENVGRKSSNNLFQYNLYRACATYFEFLQTKDRTTIGKYYAQAAVINAMSNFKDYTYVNVLNELAQLAYLYSRQNDFDKALRYINRILALPNGHENGTPCGYWFFEKANILFTLKHFKEGLETLNEGFNIENLTNGYHNDRGYEVARFYYAGSYDSTKANLDSTIKYDGLYGNANSYKTEELDKLNEIESEMRSYKLIKKKEKEIDAMKTVVSGLEYKTTGLSRNLLEKQREYKKLTAVNLSLNSTNKELAIDASHLRRKIFSDSIQLDSTQLELSLVQGQVRDAVTKKEQAETAKKRAFDFFYIALGAIAVSLWILIKVRRKLKDAKIHITSKQEQYLKEKIKSTNFALNPHFLGNLIGNLIGVHNDPKLSKESFDKHLRNIHTLVGDFFKSTSGNGVSSLIGEIERINKYVEVQKINYRNNIFEFSSNHDHFQEQISYKMIPSNILFNVIENSFIHGFIDREKQLKINILIEQHNEDGVKIIVTNNGNKISSKSVFHKGLQSIEDKIDDFNKEKDRSISWIPTRNVENIGLVKTVFTIP